VSDRGSGRRQRQIQTLRSVPKGKVDQVGCRAARRRARRPHDHAFPTLRVVQEAVREVPPRLGLDVVGVRIVRIRARIGHVPEVTASKPSLLEAGLSLHASAARFAQRPGDVDLASVRREAKIRA
jgi:hypothetical protein